MTNKITESAIETFAIELLEKQGYHYVYGPSIAPDSDRAERASFEEVLLRGRLRSAVDRINPTVPADAREDAIKQILRLSSPELIANNETFHRMLTEGIKVTYQKDGQTRGDLVANRFPDARKQRFSGTQSVHNHRKSRQQTPGCDFIRQQPASGCD